MTSVLPHPWLPDSSEPDGFQERVQQNMDAIGLALGGMNFALRFGSVDIPVTAAVNGAATVEHGLGRTPTAAFATAVTFTGRTNAGVNSFTDTDMEVVIQFVDGVSDTATITVYWLAIA